MDKRLSKNVLTTREMLKMLKVSGKIRAYNPLPPPPKMLKTREMLKMLKIWTKGFQKMCLKPGRC